MLAAAMISATAFNAPALSSAMHSSTSISMAAAKAAPVAPFPDPIANHGAEVTMKSIAWDPLNLASEENLAQYQEAELKHGRLAMLAALGWPAAELIEPALAKLTGSFDELAETGGRAPSLLNGGFEQAQIPFFLLGTFAAAGLSDYYGTANQKALNLEPGNVGFDPLSLYPTDKAEQEKYKLAELKHGRVAMVAIVLYALEEAVSGTSILKETVPLAAEIERLALEGPIQGNIDLVKDLQGDVSALLADSAKQEQAYGEAFTKAVFARPEARTVNPLDFLAPVALAFGAAAAALPGNKK